MRAVLACPAPAAQLQALPLHALSCSSLQVQAAEQQAQRPGEGQGIEGTQLWCRWAVCQLWQNAGLLLACYAVQQHCGVLLYCTPCSLPRGSAGQEQCILRVHRTLQHWQWPDGAEGQKLLLVLCTGQGGLLACMWRAKHAG